MLTNEGIMDSVHHMGCEKMDVEFIECNYDGVYMKPAEMTIVECRHATLSATMGCEVIC